MKAGTPTVQMQVKYTTKGYLTLPPESLRYRYTDTGLPRWMSGARTYMAWTTYCPFGEVEQYSLGANLGRANWQTFFYEEGTRRLAGVRVDREGFDPVDVDRVYSYDESGNPLQIADTGSTGPADAQCFQYYLPASVSDLLDSGYLRRII